MSSSGETEGLAEGIGLAKGGLLGGGAQAEARGGNLHDCTPIVGSCCGGRESVDSVVAKRLLESDVDDGLGGGRLRLLCQDTGAGVRKLSLHSYACTSIVFYTLPTCPFPPSHAPMSGKYVFTKGLKELRFLHCQTSEHSNAVRYGTLPENTTTHGCNIRLGKVNMKIDLSTDTGTFGHLDPSSRAPTPP